MHGIFSTRRCGAALMVMLIEHIEWNVNDRTVTPYTWSFNVRTSRKTTTEQKNKFKMKKLQQWYWLRKLRNVTWHDIRTYPDVTASPYRRGAIGAASCYYKFIFRNVIYSKTLPSMTINEGYENNSFTVIWFLMKLSQK